MFHEWGEASRTLTAKSDKERPSETLTNNCTDESSGNCRARYAVPPTTPDPRITSMVENVVTLCV